MATVILNSKKQLDLLLSKKITYALERTRDLVNQCVQDAINEYYKEYTPVEYQRKYKFLNSLIKTEVIQKGNELYCEVKIDEDYLRYQYYDQRTGKKTVTGLDVLNMANDHSHGGVYDEDFSCFWDDAMQTLSGEFGIITLIKNNLKRIGINID